MLGDNLMADEAADENERGGSSLTFNQKAALSTRGAALAGTPCGLCGADEPRRLCLNITLIWVCAAAAFILAVTALGVSCAVSTLAPVP